MDDEDAALQYDENGRTGVCDFCFAEDDNLLVWDGLIFEIVAPRVVELFLLLIIGG